MSRVRAEERDVEEREQLERPALVRAMEEEGARERERLREAQARLGRVQAEKTTQELLREGEARLAFSEAHRDLLLHEVTGSHTGPLRVAS